MPTFFFHSRSVSPNECGCMFAFSNWFEPHVGKCRQRVYACSRLLPVYNCVVHAQFAQKKWKNFDIEFFSPPWVWLTQIRLIIWWDFSREWVGSSVESRFDIKLQGRSLLIVLILTSRRFFFLAKIITGLWSRGFFHRIFISE